MGRPRSACSTVSSGMSNAFPIRLTSFCSVLVSFRSARTIWTTALKSERRASGFSGLSIPVALPEATASMISCASLGRSFKAPAWRSRSSFSSTPRAPSTSAAIASVWKRCFASMPVPPETPLPLPLPLPLPVQGWARARARARARDESLVRALHAERRPAPAAALGVRVRDLEALALEVLDVVDLDPLEVEDALRIDHDVEAVLGEERVVGALLVDRETVLEAGAAAALDEDAEGLALGLLLLGDELADLGLRRRGQGDGSGPRRRRGRRPVRVAVIVSVAVVVVVVVAVVVTMSVVVSVSVAVVVVVVTHREALLI